MNLDTESSGPSRRDQIEAAYASASHSSSPDTDSIVTGAREEHDREIRSRSKPADGRAQELATDGDKSHKLRSSIRTAVRDVTQQAAGGGRSSAPAKGVEVKPGPPATWDAKAKAAWHEQPPEIRMAAKREEAAFKTAFEGVKPQMQQYAELDRVLAPSRERYRSFGVKSDAEAVHSLLQWESAIANPATQKNALLSLMRQYNVNPHELAALSDGAQQHYQPQRQHQPELESAATQQVSQFGTNRPHFDEVRHTMALIINAEAHKYLQPNGNVDLEKAYREACRQKGVGTPANDRARRAANVSPASRPGPSLSARFDDAKRGSGIRGAIVGAIKQARGGV